MNAMQCNLEDWGGILGGSIEVGRHTIYAGSISWAVEIQY
jgi:hypothetical protein